MKIADYKIIKNNQLEKREKLARAFLLYSFCNLSKSEKEKHFDKQMPEVILRTMKLEGEKISASDIKEILNK
ncbi:MAG: hypothetical protein KAQ87_04635 [Candidatus Pacebacteria bacterium]|nr:hypothetical protein [Candidatus Paceibacterota bacterium]